MARRPHPNQLDLFASVTEPTPEPAETVVRQPDRRDDEITPFVDASIMGVVPGRTPMDAALIEAGLANLYSLSMGYALRDMTVPFAPRSIAFPVTLRRDRGGRPYLFLSTPACADLPYVRRVEEVTGLKAVWAPSNCDGGMWHHAIDLATDAGWERLAGSMEHTKISHVLHAVGLNVFWGELSVGNARALLERIGEPEPADARPAILGSWAKPFGASVTNNYLHGWGSVRAIELGWATPKCMKGKREIEAAFTEAGLAAIAEARASKIAA
jgi:hypothetical protein